MAAIGALCLAGSAEATPGIDAWWGNTTVNGQVKGGLGNVFKGIALNVGSGEVYVVDRDNNRIQRFSGAGDFIAAWGRDVDSLTAATGYEICPAVDKEDCKQAAPSTGLGGELSSPQGIAVNQVSGHIYVTDSANNRIQEFDSSGAFIRAFGKDVVQGGSSGFEICEVAANCKAGVKDSSAGAISTNGYLSVAPASSPNAGNVLVAETNNKRVQEFSSTGQFVRAFGWDVVASGPGDDTTAPVNEFEVCTTADVCKAGSSGVGSGEFAEGTPTRVAEGKDGSIYTVETQQNTTGNFRVQRFTLPGNVVTPQGEFAAAALHGTSSKVVSDTEPPNGTREVAVDDAGFLYAVKAFPKGTGTPPVTIDPVSEARSQERVLKVDPVSEEVVATMAVNPGLVANTAFESIQGLVVAPAGTPIYATTNQPDRVYRLNEIAGLGATVEDADEVGASTARLKATITPAAIPLNSAYRFEYSGDGINWTRVPIPDFELGNGSAGGTASTCPLPKAASCQVSQKVTGLVPNTTYQVRVVAHTLFNEGVPLIVPGPDFTTVAAAPVTRSGAALWSSPAPTHPSLSLGGTINPGHDRTTYFFEYVDEASYLADKGSGDGFQHATRTPTALAAEAGHGLRDVSVRRVIAGLDSAKTYHYRLVATNSVGTKQGADRSVAPPNPSDRFFERVSNGDSWGSGVEADIGGLADDGERAMFAAQAFGQPSSLPSLGTPFVAERSSSGWGVSEMLPDPARAIPPSLQSEAKVAADLGTMLWAESSLGERERSEAQFGFAHIDGTRSPASPQLTPLAHSGKGFYKVIGASRDLKTIVFAFNGGTSGAVKLLSEETLPAAGRSNLYEVSDAGGPSPELEVLNRASNPSPGIAGAIIGGVCGASMGGGGLQTGILTHALAADGSIAYFSAYPGAPASGKCEATGPKRLFKRIDGETTVEVSKSQCTRTVPTPCDTVTNGDDEYKGASADGSVVFFTSPRQLTDSDQDTTSDLYAYDATPPAGQPNLVQASAGETIGAHTAGKGAKVLGVLDNATDGSRVYFVAEGVLSGLNLRGKAPVANQKNLYVYERDAAQPSGRVGFVGALLAGGTGDEKEWLFGESEAKYATALPVSGEEGDGHVLVFASAAKLLSADTDSAKDVYRYDDSAVEAAKSLQCASCVGNGPFEARLALRTTGGTSLPNYAQQSRVASADLSTIVFTSQEKLAGSADENETWDLYAWHDGTLSLVSAGTEGFGAAGSLHASSISPDGRDILFVTRAPLVGSDTNNALDLYDARIGGGFPEQAAAEECIDESACKGPTPPPPPPPPPAGSATFSGPGNQTSPGPCKKGKVRKGGKCVKKPSQHKGKHKKQGKKKQGKRASHKRGVGR